MMEKIQHGSKSVFGCRSVIADYYSRLTQHIIDSLFLQISTPPVGSYS